MLTLLDFDKAPPFSAPLRFFLTAPLFLALAGGLLLVEGPALLASRWMPGALAATHLVTIGFMLLTMVGALFQILPVVTGASISRPGAVSRLVHGALTLGALSLAGGFLHGDPFLFGLAATLLAAGVLVFIVAAGMALWRVPTTSPTIRGLKLALPGLLGVVFLGVWLALAVSRGWMVPLVEMVNLHAAWGFAAWGGTVLAAVCYVAVPMFHLTPPYRARPSWWIPPLILFFSGVWAAAVVLEAPWLGRVSEAGLSLLGIAFALYTFYLQSQRRRAHVDVPTRYWQCGLISVAAAMVMAFLAALNPELTELPQWAPLFGILLALGGFATLIIGMLYRIVPFLVWLHLHQNGSAPSVGKILPEKRMRPQMWAHFAAIGMVVASIFLPDYLARPAGAALIAAAAYLLLNLFVAAKVYSTLRLRKEP